MVLRAAAAVARHPELTLSRRDILKFILIEPGKRAAEVQTLLQLDALDTQRKALKAALTKLGRDSTTAAAALAAARQTVGRHLDLPVPQLVPDEVLRVINGTRAMLELPPLTEVTLETDFKQGVAEQAAEVTLDKLSALRDIDALQGALADGEGSAPRPSPPWPTLRAPLEPTPRSSIRSSSAPSSRPASTSPSTTGSARCAIRSGTPPNSCWHTCGRRSPNPRPRPASRQRFGQQPAR